MTICPRKSILFCYKYWKHRLSLCPVIAENIYNVKELKQESSFQLLKQEESNRIKISLRKDWVNAKVFAISRNESDKEQFSRLSGARVSGEARSWETFKPGMSTFVNGFAASVTISFGIIQLCPIFKKNLKH